MSGAEFCSRDQIHSQSRYTVCKNILFVRKTENASETALLTPKPEHANAPFMQHQVVAHDWIVSALNFSCLKPNLQRKNCSNFSCVRSRFCPTGLATHWFCVL